MIITPHALPMYRETWTKKRRTDAEERASKRQLPDPGQAYGQPGKDGRLGATGGTLLTQHIMKQKVG